MRSFPSSRVHAEEASDLNLPNISRKSRVTSNFQLRLLREQHAVHVPLIESSTRSFVLRNLSIQPIENACDATWLENTS